MEATLSPHGHHPPDPECDPTGNEDSQFIISTHSPMLMTFPNAEIYQIREGGIDSLPYNETEHYKTTVRFLRDPESALEDILGEPETTRS